MSKDHRLHFRLDDKARNRLKEACALTGLDEATALRACILAFVDYVEQTGEIRLPLAVVPKPKTTTVKIATPTFPSTAAPVPSRASSLNEEPPARPVVPVAAPRITKTRAVLKRMVAKEKKKP